MPKIGDEAEPEEEMKASEMKANVDVASTGETTDLKSGEDFESDGDE